VSSVDDFRADRRRYPPHAWLFERSIWSVAIYRAQRLIIERSGGLHRIPLLGRAINGALMVLSLVAQVLTGNELHPQAQIGPGLRIHHSGNVIVNPRAVLGRDCTLRHGVSIGNLEPGGPAPRLGDRVELGAYAQIFGDITIGDGARIGAMSVVLKDVPAGATAVGAPARVTGPSS
jgi:serine O-acetyltransferase